VKTRNQAQTRAQVEIIVAILSVAFLTSCATPPQGGGRLVYAPAVDSLREARSSQVPVEKRAADYLQVAAMTAPLLGTGSQETPARDTYNIAAAELTVLLRSGDGGRLWNHPVTLANGSESYRLHLQPAGPAIWAPNYFTAFELPREIERKGVKRINRRDGVGGALVGLRTISPRENFAPFKGIAAPVTTTLEFKEEKPRFRCDARQNNRRQQYKGKFGHWQLITQRRSLIIGRRPISWRKS
jgi:hypothetical protein